MIVTRIFSFLAPLAVGQHAYVMSRCPSCVRPSVSVLTFSLNIFFSETTYQILMKLMKVKSSCQKPIGLELPNLTCSFT